MADVSARQNADVALLSSANKLFRGAAAVAEYATWRLGHIEAGGVQPFEIGAEEQTLNSLLIQNLENNSQLNIISNEVEPPPNPSQNSQFLGFEEVTNLPDTRTLSGALNDVDGSYLEADDVSSTSVHSERSDTTLRCRRRLSKGKAHHSLARYVQLLDGFLVGSNDRALRDRPGFGRRLSKKLPRVAKFKLPEKKGADVGVELVKRDEQAEHVREEKTVEQKLEEAITWLASRQLLSAEEQLQMAPKDIVRRWEALSTVQFGAAVTQDMQKAFLCRLVPLTHMLAVEQTDLGLITDPKYVFKLNPSNLTPIKESAIPYPPHVEKWLEGQLEVMVNTQRIVPVGPDDDAPMVTSLVLVPEGQTGQAFRICQNLIPVNKRTPELHRAIQDCRRVLARMGRRRFASLIDLKAGYHNIPFDPETNKYAIFTCHKGKYKWLRMPFGLTNAPAHFQWVMEDIIHGAGPDMRPQQPLDCEIYLDDFTVLDDTVEGCLEQTFQAIQRLATAGAMVSLKKSIICTEEGKVLGHRWHSGGYFTAETKGLKALLSLPHEKLADLPRASIYGLLSYFRPYVSDFAVRTEPLRKLLAASSSEWNEAHTSLVQDVVQRVLEALPVINFDPASTVRVQLSVGPAGFAGILLQKDPQGNRWLPIASHSRTLSPEELLLSKLELEVRALQETFSKLRHICAFSPDIQVLASPELRHLITTAPRLHPDLWVRVIDIRAYNPTFATQPVAGFPAASLTDSVGEWLQPDDQDDAPAPELQESLGQPAHMPRGARFLGGPAVHLMFDGGSQQGLGTAGYVVIDSKGQEVVRVGVQLGQGYTNNEAEASALLMALQQLEQLQGLGVPWLDANIRVLGDSSLIIKWMLGLHKKVTKPSLYQSIMGAKQLIRRRGWRVSFRNVPRAYNAAADDMAQRARQLPGKGKIDLSPSEVKTLLQSRDIPSADLAQLYAALEWSEYAQLPPSQTPSVDPAISGSQAEAKQGTASIAIGRPAGTAGVAHQPTGSTGWLSELSGPVLEAAGVPCTVCKGLQGEGDMLLCDRCPKAFHQECARDAGHPEPHDGPWLCKGCRGHVAMFGFSDVTHDFGLTDYLWTGVLSDQLEEANRIKATAANFRAMGKELQRRLPQFEGLPGSFRWASVPPIAARHRIIRDVHLSTGHVGRDKLLSTVGAVWWWPNMRATVTEVLRCCPACQSDRPHPIPQESYRPTVRPERPGRGWSLDLAGPFPADEDGHTYLAVAVDCLSKWVEATPLKSKHAFRTAEWFFSEVVARWSKPDWVRTDHGTEWAGSFSKQLRMLGIKHLKNTVGNSKANGQAERTIRTLKDIMRREMAIEPDTYWSDHLPAALIALRHTAARSHGFPPFTVVTGLLPVLPSDVTSVPHMPPDAATPSQEEEYVRQMQQVVDQVRQVMKLRLTRMEIRLQRKLKKDERQQVSLETLIHFRPGDLVLRRRKVVGKLAARAQGPYQVIKVGGSFLQRITIVPREPTVGPKRAREIQPVEVHASQLIPYVEGDHPAAWEQAEGIMEDIQQQEGQLEQQQRVPTTPACKRGRLPKTALQ